MSLLSMSRISEEQREGARRERERERERDTSRHQHAAWHVKLVRIAANETHSIGILFGVTVAIATTNIMYAMHDMRI